MTPSVVARQLQDSLVDYILATLALDDPAYVSAFEAFLRGPDGLFRGPYVRLGLPFLQVAPDEPVPLTIRPPFPPYAHQLQAFRQLNTSDQTPRNTLVTTGTGSGKTECFLYPVLDHCFRHAGEPGIKAIVIYPMNALATDQARRLASAIHGDERLRGKVTAGLYVGGDDSGTATSMGPDHLIENRQTLRNAPPDILLTNYKMLDFMLLRPDERKLWQHNRPETLRYLVIDELHTFDGAQGSDVACLVRRLKARLDIPDGRLVCCGTSATIGSSTDPETFERLAAFATEVFGEPFEAAHVVRETRLRREDFLLPGQTRRVLPDLPDPGVLDPELQEADAWLRAQQALWLGEVFQDPVALGEALRAHPMVHQLLALASSAPRTLAQLDEALLSQVGGWGALKVRQRLMLLDSLLGLVSHARRRVGKGAAPLLTVQVQLWSRELHRLLRALPDLAAGETEPRFAWFSDLPHVPRHGPLLAPQAHCRECGIVGLAAVQTVQDQQHGRLSFSPSAVGDAWLHSHRDACFVWPRPLEESERQGELVYWLDPETGTLGGQPFLDEEGQRHGTPIVLEQTRTQGQVPRFAARCPACGQDDALRIMGARAASLTSVAVTHLFQSPFNEDKKLLAFTDSVQDAAHRAGFFGGRTFRIHLRTALQAVIAARDPLRLSEAARAFEDHWRPALGDTAYVASFLPPDLRELPEYHAWVERKGKGQHDQLFEILRERLYWEFIREFGVAAGIGRSLERSAASSLSADPERLSRAVEAFSAWYSEQGEADPSGLPEHFLRGLLHRMRHMGALHHRYLERYVQRDGDRFLLTKKQNPHMSPEGRFAKRIRFLVSQPRGEVFLSPFGRRAHTGWFGDWMRRTLRWPNPGPDALSRVYRRALDALTEAGLLQAVRHPGGWEIWGLDPEGMRLTTQVGSVQQGAVEHGPVEHLALDDAIAADGKPSWAFRAEGALHRVPTERGYYAKVYSRGTLSRVFSSEHTGLLEREARAELERRFLRGATPEDPQAPNLLVATPTLEMGVDIGDLSATLLCSVPPTPANYLQRVGRAGRKTGNALVFVMANTSAHDLYFHTEPEAMLDGVIVPPGVYLGAVAMLQRQLTAWCMDRWAQHDDGAEPIPRKASLVLGEAGREQFLGRLIRYLRGNHEVLLASFLERFGRYLGDESRQLLEAWTRSVEQGLTAHLQGAFDALGEQIDGYQKERDKALKRIKALEEDPTQVGNAAQEIADLKRYRMVLTSLIEDLRNKYPLNVLAEASLLPNYAFPESGVHLHSLLGGQDEDGENKKRTYEKREYVRPAANALRELAPFNTFYAEGHKVQIRQLELGPKASRVQHWRFCPSCHHAQRTVEPGQPPQDGACPRCGDPGWVDKGQVRTMLPLTLVRSVADRLRSTTVDDTDERDSESYHIHQVFDIQPEHLDGEAVYLPQLGFGFEYLKRVTLTEINLGLSGMLATAPKVRLAGEEASAEGFSTCKDCGGVLDPRQAGQQRSNRDEHTPFCPQRKGDSKARLPLYLFREVTSEALRFLLPFSTRQVDQQLRSFQAAIDFGLRRRFRGRPMHLAVATMTEPEPTNRTLRKHFLVLFDIVPGGTGYLRDFRRRREVFALLQDTLEGLQRCPCRQRGRDGCYLCLFSHTSQRYLPILSSRLAERLLDRVLAARDTAQTRPGGLSVTTAEGVHESELEERLMDALALRYPDRLQSIEGGRAWELAAGASVWRIDAQVDLSAEAGEPTRADFVFTGIQGPALDERVVVECDGFAFHALPGKPRGRIADDVRKRVALASRPGWRVFSLTWQDLDPNVPAATAPIALAGVSAAVWSRVFERARKELPEAFHSLLARLPELGPWELFCGYLEQPGSHWRDGVAALLCAGLAGAGQAGQLLDGHAQLAALAHLREAPELTPLPPLGLQKAPKAPDVWARASVQQDCAAMVSARGTDIQRFDADGLQVILRLDDDEVHRSSQGFVESWRRLLQGLNLALMLPLVEVFTTEGLRDDRVADDLAPDGSDVLGALGLLAAEPAPGPGSPGSDLERVLEKCLDDETRALVRAAHAARLPLPDLEPMELPGGAPAELTWSALRVAVGRPQDLEEQDQQRAREAGWTLLLMPTDPDALASALNQARTP